MITTIINNKLRRRANFHKIVYAITEHEIIIPQLYNERYNGAKHCSMASKLLQNEIVIKIKQSQSYNQIKHAEKWYTE